MEFGQVDIMSGVGKDLVLGEIEDGSKMTMLHWHLIVIIKKFPLKINELIGVNYSISILVYVLFHGNFSLLLKDVNFASIIILKFDSFHLSIV
jgi:hypothetical protein